MSSQTFDDATPLSHEDELVAWMAAGGRPPERWVCGTEHEKLGWWPDLARHPTWEGPRGIGALLEALARDAGWAPTYEGADIIALKRDRATITLEPGGQLELSGAPLRTLAELVRETDAHFEELRRFSAPLGLEWYGLGMAPTARAEDMPRMPKARYGIMRQYLPTVGTTGLDMMHLTCTVQANLDYADADDAMRKFRVALMLQPLVVALWAASTVRHGHLVPERSFRMRIWDDVDRARCVLPDALLKRDATLSDYVTWALDAPMFFIHRDAGYIRCDGLPFRRFMAEGFGGHRPNMGDFALHLSTLFPDVRLKQHLEVRAADMGDRDHILALSALHVGALYDAQTLDALFELFADVGPDAWRSVRDQVVVDGLSATLAGRSLADWWARVLPLVEGGLGRWEPGATPLLDVLSRDLSAGECPADRMRRAWNGDVGAFLAPYRVC